MDVAEVDTLTTLLQRVDILAACRDSPISRTTICERANCSRATAYRATADLEERGLVERRDGRYRVTTVGAAAVERTQHFQMGFKGASTLEPVLEHVDVTALVDAMHLFGGAEVFEATPGVPYSLERRLESIIDETDTRLIGATGSYSSAMVTKRSCELVDSGVDGEHVITPFALENVQKQSGDNDDEDVGFDRTGMYVVDEIPLDLLLYDDTLVVPAPDAETGALAAMAVTENPRALVWAEYLVDRHRSRGEPLTA